jgi:hypothetical protein
VVYQPTMKIGPRTTDYGLRTLVAGRYVLEANNQVRFLVSSYDPTRPLVIDPVLSYSTYLGGSNEDEADAVAVDTAGSAYVTGYTASSNFPTVNPFQSQCASCAASTPAWDVFVSKLNSAGNALAYSTFLDGSGNDLGGGIAVDAAGNAYVTGSTQSPDFPTVNAYESVYSGLGDAFVTKINPTGSALVYSTYLHLSIGNSIAVDGAGNAYVTGAASSGFPTANARQPTPGGGTDAFVTKLNPSGAALVYSTFLGGSAEDGGRGIAVDAAGNAYVTGFTKSTDFPTAHPLQASNAGGTCGTAPQTYTCPNVFVTKLNPAGSALIYSTYLGGSNQDFGNGIAVDAAGSAYLTGYTQSSNFPTANPFQASYGGGTCGTGSQAHACNDAFVTKLNSTGSALVYSTYLGGSADDQGFGIAVDSADNAYVAGGTSSTDFPTVNSLQPDNSPYGTIFVAKFDTAGLALVYSTYLGGSLQDFGSSIAVDAANNAYITGGAGSSNFPVVGALQAKYGGDIDAFVAKISPGGAAPALSPSPPNLAFSPQSIGSSSTPQTVTVTNTGATGLTISTVMFGGTNASDFAASTDTCAGATVAPNDTCKVGITFTPSTIEGLSATLIFTDNASGSPQSVGLSGSGPDFTLAPPSVSSTSATTAPGAPATYNLSVGGEGGISGQIAFTCTGAPSEATCNVSPNPATVGSSPTKVTVTVTTTHETTVPTNSASPSRPVPPAPPQWPGLTGLVMLALVLAAMAWAIGHCTQAGVSRWQPAMLPIALGLFLILALTGCGSGGGGGGSPPGTVTDPGTPVGTYTLTVTASEGWGASAVSHSVKLTLTVVAG